MVFFHHKVKQRLTHALGLVREGGEGIWEGRGGEGRGGEGMVDEGVPMYTQ